MKTKIYLLLLAGILLTACSGDDAATTDAPATELTLQKVEKFSPSLELYTAGAAESFKNVKYYNDNRVVADTTFDALGNVYSTVEHTYTATTHTLFASGVPNVISTTRVLTHDSDGRLVEDRKTLHNSGMSYIPVGISTFTYNSDGTITRNAVDPDTNEIMSNYAFNYITGSNGLVTTINYDPAASTFIFDGDKPVKYSHNNGADAINQLNFSYYTTPLPNNMRLTNAQINNAILEDGFEMAIADNCNYYIQSYDGFVTFDKLFNSLNYVTYSKATGNIHQEQYDSETFYYYN